MLKTRILTALLIVPATLALVFLAPAWVFRLAVGVLLLIGAWEFRRLADLGQGAGVALIALQAAIVAGLLLTWPATARDANLLLQGACIAWLLLFLRLALYRPGDAPSARYRRLGFVSAVGSLSFCLFALCWLREQASGPWLVFLLFLMIWAADVGAYFSGRFLGRHKLAPRISPNKTWEGVAGGIALATAAAFLLTALVDGLAATPTALLLLSVATTLSSVGGDLFISIHKRTVGIKDTGRLFPGHGGVLDRYDSLLAGAPFFALAWTLLAP
ncbi:MAG: phosphatidate cytidylyltransferase [Xanthomonadales bacterium]|nr:phosphatidate cytidylyltransferase [Xanthomonadales bacterium]